MKKNYSYMNFLRFFSFGGIIFYHMVVQLIFSEIRTEEEIIGLFLYPNFHIAMIGVDLFFMLSGAGLFLSALDSDSFDLRGFFRKRFERILIPYYLVFTGYAILKLVVGKGEVFEPGIPLWRIIFTFLGMDQYLTTAGFECFTLGIGEWFLGCLMLLYLLYPLLQRCMRSHPHLTMAVFTVYYVLMIHFDPLPVPPMHTNFFFKIYDFVLGMYLAWVWRRLASSELSAASYGKKVIGILSLTVVCLFLFYPGLLPGTDEPKATIFSLAIYCLFMVCEEILKQAGDINRFLDLFSAFSYEIFLVHHVVIFQVMRLFFGKRWPLPQLLLILLLELVLMVAGGTCVKLICSKITARLHERI